MREHRDDFGFEWQEAKREASPLTLAIAGLAGSGKTYSALLLARGLVGPDGVICVLDSEGRRARMYGGRPEIGTYYCVDLWPPYSSKQYLAALKFAIGQGAQCVIIDSASHEHEAMLDYADAEEGRLANKGHSGAGGWAKWKDPKRDHNRFMSFATAAPCHVIFCLRLKTVTDMKTSADKNVPICGRDLEYLMQVIADVEEGTNKATFRKLPLPFHGIVKDGDRLTVEHGRAFAEEVAKGESQDRDVTLELRVSEEIAAEGMERLKLYTEGLKQHKPSIIEAMTRARPGHFHQLKAMAEAADNERAIGQAENEQEDLGIETPMSFDLADE